MLLDELEHPCLFQLEGNAEVAMVTLVSQHLPFPFLYQEVEEKLNERNQESMIVEVGVVFYDCQ